LTGSGFRDKDAEGQGNEETVSALPDYITSDVKALIGVEGPLEETAHPVEASEVRRFQHACLDTSPRHWNADYAARSRYKGLVAPPTFPVFAFRRHFDTPDPLDAMQDNPDHDGHGIKAFRNLPPPPIPLRRILNGGYKYCFYRFAGLGERIFRKSRYRDIYQKNGRSGPMVLLVIDDIYLGGDKTPLLLSTQTIILR
jgi:hydroxyacyl-ACP dehydratase HTD2-like protein with hotdog domain